MTSKNFNEIKETENTLKLRIREASCYQVDGYDYQIFVKEWVKFKKYLVKNIVINLGKLH